VAPLSMAQAMIHRPPELAALEDQERNRKGAKQQALGVASSAAPALPPAPEDEAPPPPEAIQAAQPRMPLAGKEVEVPELSARSQYLRPPGGGYGNEEIHQEVNDPAWAWWAHSRDNQPDTIPARLSIELVRPPDWVEAWIRQYFQVSEDSTAFTFAPDRNLSWLALRGPTHTPNPDKPGPQTIEEEYALFMNVNQEVFLRYGRCHFAVLASMFRGLRKSWCKRFFDLTAYDDVIVKTTDRQICEAVCIARNIIGSAGHYSAEDAFREYGVAKPWLQKFFVVKDDGSLGIDDDVQRKWDPPYEEKAPNPSIYYHLDVPKGIHRKHGGGTRKDKVRRYLPRKYGHTAGGILY